MKEEVLRTLLSATSVLILVFLPLRGGFLALVRRLICRSLFPLFSSTSRRSLSSLVVLVLPSLLLVFLVLLAILAQWLKEASQRMRLQVRVTGILDLLMMLSRVSLPLIM